MFDGIEMDVVRATLQIRFRRARCVRKNAVAKYRVRAAAVCWQTDFRHEGNVRRIWF